MVQKKRELDKSTEEKIKDAARLVFSQKGYAATRTRDIAEAAQINLALVNYYFRSKEKLFHEVMIEKVYQLFGTIIPILVNPALSFEAKIDITSDSYIDMLIENPDLPLLVFHELKNNPEGFGIKVQIAPLLKESSFYIQINERNAEIDPIQIILSIFGMLVFPFIAKPVFSGISGLNPKNYKEMLQERKKLIPMWVNAIIDAKPSQINIDKSL